MPNNNQNITSAQLIEQIKETAKKLELYSEEDRFRGVLDLMSKYQDAIDISAVKLLKSDTDLVIPRASLNDQLRGFAFAAVEHGYTNVLSRVIDVIDNSALLLKTSAKLLRNDAELLDTPKKVLNIPEEIFNTKIELIHHNNNLLLYKEELSNSYKELLNNYIELLDTRLKLLCYRDQNGCDVLMHACKHLNKEAVKYLLEQGVNPNAQDHRGNTAAMHLIGTLRAESTDSCLELLKELVIHNADFSLVDNNKCDVLWRIMSILSRYDDSWNECQKFIINILKHSNNDALLTQVKKLSPGPRKKLLWRQQVLMSLQC